MRRAYGAFCLLAVVVLLISACSSKSEAQPEIINLDRQGFIRAQEGVQAMMYITSVSYIKDGHKALQRVQGFFDNLTTEVAPRDADLAEQLKNTTALLDQSFQQLEGGQGNPDTLQQIVGDGGKLLGELNLAAKVLGIDVPAATPIVTPTSTPTTAASPTPSASPTPAASVSPSPSPTLTPTGTSDAAAPGY